MRKADPSFDRDIEKSIEFLVRAGPKESDKPVIIHSIRVGLFLYKSGYNKDIVTAGILHDLLEDSNTTYEEIRKKFGINVAKLVNANSYDKKYARKNNRKQKGALFSNARALLKSRSASVNHKSR